jgi:hypothetical protein
MSHLWIASDTDGWSACELESAPHVLRPTPPTLTRQEPVSLPAPHGALLLPCARSADPDSFALLARTRHSVRVNGVPLQTGIRVLRDRDSIQLANRPPMYFSSQRLPVVEPFPETDEPRYCPRCKSSIEPGTPAVRCVACGSWYHQSDEFPCWTYADSCVCGHPTNLDGDYRWTPHEI